MIGGDKDRAARRLGFGVMDLRFRTLFIARIYSSIFLLNLSEAHALTLSACSSARESTDLLCNLPFHELWSLGELCDSFLSQSHIEQSREYWLIKNLLELPDQSQARCLLDHAIEEMLEGQSEILDPCPAEKYSRTFQTFPDECWSGPHVYITEPPKDYSRRNTHGSRPEIQPEEDFFHYREFVADEIILGGTTRSAV
jgi:hypothetical protein